MASISELSDQLNYGKKRFDSERSSKLRGNVDFFLSHYGKKCPAVKAWGDFKRTDVQQFVLEMTDQFLRQEGSTLWPEDEYSPLYNESLVWPRDEKKIKEPMSKMFFLKNMHKQRSDHQMSQKRKSNHTTTPSTPTSSRNMNENDIRTDNQTNPAQESFNLEGLDEPDPSLPPRMLTPKQEAEVRALAEESFPTISSSTKLFIDADRPGKDKDKSEDRSSSQTREEHSVMESELTRANRLRSPLNRIVENISRSRTSASPSSTVSHRLLSPSTQPRAPQPTMIDADDASHSSFSIMTERRQETGSAALEILRSAISWTSLEPEIWYCAIKSHKPKVTKSWESKAGFSDMTLTQLKDELLRGFDDATLSDIRCTLNGPDERKAEVEIDHTKKSHILRLKTIFESEIKEAIEEDKGEAASSPLSFLIEIEPV